MPDTQGAVNELTSHLLPLNIDTINIAYEGLDDTVNKWGVSIDIDTVDANGTTTSQVVWPVKSTTQVYIFLDAPVTARLDSALTADSSSGRGARTVLVTYQNSSGDVVQQTISTTGATGTQLDNTTLGCFRMQVVTSGSENKNVGILNLVNVANGEVLAMISANEGQTQIAVQRVPNGKTGKIVSHFADYARTGAANDAVMRLYIRKVDGTIVTKADPTITTTSSKHEKNYSVGGIVVNSGEWVFWKVISVSANNTPIRAGFDMKYITA